MGINETKYKSHLTDRQIMGPLYRYTDKLKNKLEDFIPFNFAVSLYSSLRAQYKVVMKSLLSALVQNEEQPELWLIV